MLLMLKFLIKQDGERLSSMGLETKILINFWVIKTRDSFTSL